VLQWEKQFRAPLYRANVSQTSYSTRVGLLITTYLSPYYIWLGCSRQRDTSDAVQAFEVEAGNRVIVPPSFAELSFSHILMAQKQQQQDEKSGSQSTLSDASTLVRRRGSENWSTSSSSSAIRLDLGPHVPLSSFHYQKRQWRLPYGEYFYIYRR
jgi:betaine lipid synthase